MTRLPSSVALMVSMTSFLLAASAVAEPDAHGKSQPVSRPVTTGGCTEGFAAYSVSTDFQQTAAQSYQDVTGTTIPFTQGKNGCVEVSFTAEAATMSHELMLARALVDGRACIPSGNIFASDSFSNDLADHGMNYICRNVAPGNHTVKMQFRSRFGRKVALEYRTTIVRYIQ